MKKVLIIICSSIILIFSILFIDFLVAKSNKNKPIFSIKKVNEEEQVEVYYGLFYKSYKCLSDEEIYVTKNIFSNINNNFCPKKYTIDFKDGYYINNKNVKISKVAYEKLNQFYSVDKIINMTENDLEEAFNEIDKWVPITNQ